MKYTRENPSPRYTELLEQYRAAHRDGLPGYSADSTFDGGSLAKELGKIRDLIRLTGSRSMLDYGCGKAKVYHLKNFKTNNGESAPSVVEFLGIERIRLYDPGIPELSVMPEGTFDGVICVDVLEHCPESDIPWILGELFDKAERFVFANVASYPARKKLANGENAHCTQQPAEWWQDQLAVLNARHPNKALRFEVLERSDDHMDNSKRVKTLSNIKLPA